MMSTIESFKPKMTSCRKARDIALKLEEAVVDHLIRLPEFCPSRLQITMGNNTKEQEDPSSAATRMISSWSGYVKAWLLVSSCGPR